MQRNMLQQHQAFNNQWFALKKTWILLLFVFSIVFGLTPSCDLFAADHPIRIMPLGDSITYDNYYSDDRPETLRTAYRGYLWLSLIQAGYQIEFVGSQRAGQGTIPPFDPDNEGHPGWSDSEIAAEVYNFLSQNPADIVLLHIGTNDLDTSPDDVEAILDEIDAFETDSGIDVSVVLARIINRSEYSQTTAQFNVNIAEMAQARIDSGDSVVIVDMEDGAGLDYRLYPEGDMQDNLHPRAVGYQKMANVWLASIVTILPPPEPYAPQIITEPRNTAVMGYPYVYHISSTGNPLAVYYLLLGPEEAQLDELNGTLTWVPDSLGNYDFSVEAWNSEGTDTQSFSVTVETPGMVWIEAESGAISAPMQEAQDINASDGVYVIAARGSGGSVEHNFQVAESGDYVVWARVIAKDTGSNSFYVSMDNGDQHLWDMPTSVNWMWDRVSNRSMADPSFFYLVEGSHTLKITKRETGAQIDKILITSDLNYVPSGFGSETKTLFIDLIGGGQVTKDPDQAGYQAGDPVFLTAEPYDGWQFNSWSGDLTGNQNPVSIVMDADKNITALFSTTTPVQYQLSVSSSGSGTVTTAPAGGLHDAGTLVLLNAVPQNGWQFNGWSGDLTGNQNPVSIVMDADKNITALFSTTTPVQYQLSVSSSGSGTVTTAPAGGLHDAGTLVLLNAVPQDGWQFNGWSGDLTGNQNPVSIVMDADKNITALFSNTGSQSDGIWVEAESGTITAPMQEAQDINASEGAYVLAARGSGGSSEYSLQVVESGDYVVWARVIAKDTGSNSFYVSMDNGDQHLWDMPTSVNWMWDRVSNRSGPDPSIFSLQEGVHTLKITKRETGAQIDKILITSDLNYVPSGFGSETKTLFIDLIGGGQVTKDPDQAGYQAGDPVFLTAEPYDGWQFNGWGGDLTGNQNPVSIVMDTDKNIRALFSTTTPVQYQLSVSSSGSGAVTTAPAGGLHDAGTLVLLNAVPQDGWQFNGWSGDLTGNQNPVSIVMDADKNITALFSNTGSQSDGIWIEAESGTITAPMQEAQDINASEGAYVLAARGSGGSVEHDFHVAESGDYVVWARVIAKDTGSNSFYVSMDNGDQHLWDMPTSVNWMWDRVSSRSGPDPSRFYLQEGVHTLKIMKRETGAQVDRILITSDLGYLP